MPNAYYNENDPKAAEWLRQLIEQDLIAPGDVDERSIEDVRPADLTGYHQCHFFAGIGGWSYALRLAGWPDDRPVWTGSCPCQPFSSAGAQGGTDDPRHLWPHFRWLIDQRRPAIVFGEQVASKAGRHWFAGVRSDLEAMGYAAGCADLCAASVEAPQSRQRLYWLADSDRQRREGQHPLLRAEATGRDQADISKATGRGSSGSGLACTSSNGGSAGLSESCERQARIAKESFDGSGGNGAWAGARWIVGSDEKARRIEPGTEPLVDGLPGRVGLLRGYGNAIVPQLAAEFIQAAVN